MAIPSLKAFHQNTETIHPAVPNNTSPKEELPEDIPSRDTFSFYNTEPLYKQNNSDSFYKAKKRTYHSPFHYTATGHLVRLSSTSSASAVRGIIQNVNNNICKAKFSDATESEKQSAIRKMKRIINKAHIKLSILKSEDNLERQELLARAMEHNRQAAELVTQQQKSRRVRKSLDQCSIVDSEDIGTTARSNLYSASFTNYDQNPAAECMSTPSIAAPVSIDVSI